MELMEQVNNDIKTAMKAQEKERLNALRFLKSKLIENKTAAKPQAEMDVLISHHKKLKDSLASFPEGNEIRMNTEKEIVFLEAYLPAQMTEDEVKKLIASIKASNPGANMGMVMKELQPQIKGKFDGKRASELVKEALA